MNGKALVPRVVSTPNQINPAGAVLVVGAGISGMQAALDCANSGLKVFLVERQPAIGGNMARLDKTFPTNDCAMCMISPKLVEAGRHHNIEIITNAELTALGGEAGDFRAQVLKHPRFVDEEKCNGCGDCETACPVSVDRFFDGNLSKRKAVYRLFPQAIPNVYSIDKNGISPCRLGCPTGVNAHGYVALTAQGKYGQALALIRESNPFVGSCGMVCAHPCESECSRAEIDGAVSICAIKRFVFEHAPDTRTEPPAPTREKRVAVIGSGPAGLSCAYAIRGMGYPTTVFEASSVPGGMLRLAIPDFRLPSAVVERDVDFIRRAGVDIRLNTPIGRDLSFDRLREDFDAVFVASGAPKGKQVAIPGIDVARKGVLLGIEFLKAVKAGQDVRVGARVVVIGGGNTALDIARTASRRGASWVRCVEMLAEDKVGSDDDEVQAARLEGISVEYSTTVKRVETENGAVRAVRCARLQAAGPGSEFTWPVDTVIMAVGQYSDVSFVPEDIKRTERGTLAADPDTLATSHPGVFAGGDVVAGPDILVKAIAAGRRAAVSIDRYLRGEQLGPVRLVPEGVKSVPAEIRRPKKERIRLYDSQGNPEPDLEARARAEAERCLNCGACSGCLQCVTACKPGAISHDMVAATRELEVGAVILASGYDLFDARRKSEYGFGRFANVVTSLQFERILSASGPTQGHLQRPSDGRVPARIAWIQCVGSRDVSLGNDYCSSVCCMAAAKQTILARDHEPAVQAVVFFTDARAFAKGSERFYDRARAEQTRYVRAQVSSLREDPRSGNLLVRYAGIGAERIVEESFDMVVLSVGLVARQGTAALAGILGTATDRFGFLAPPSFLPSVTDREGVFSCGAANGPKDIPETVTESSTAAALCAELLHAARGTRVSEKQYPPEKIVDHDEPRIGVFVCHCGTNISSVVDVKAVAEHAGRMPGVVHAESTIYACSQDSQKNIRQTISDKGLNRVIVASCTPRTHEPLFRETIREAGLNRFMFEMADIREQCSWVHRAEPARATLKARSLVSGSVGKSRLLEPIAFRKVGVTPAALVIGGGASGMAASLSFARQGYSVFLVERDEDLGGNLRHIRRSVKGFDWQVFLEKQIADVLSHPNIRVFLGSEVAETKGFVGNFVTKVQGASSTEIRHGVVVVATGAQEFQGSGFLQGQDKRVVTQRELEDRVQPGFSADRVVMIQCVGSRCEERPYCSRVCCTEAVKNALAIKELRPSCEVTVLYREMRTYAFNELYYRKAREKGVSFVRFPDDAPPEVSADAGSLRVRARDAQLDEPVELQADLVVLSAGIVPAREGNERISELLKIPLDADKFFMEAHVKLRPVDCTTEGIFICGLAHSPKTTEENIGQALAAAGRAAAVLSRDSLEVGGVVAVVDEDKCAACLTCVRECLYGAPFINEHGKAGIEAVKCQGCGACAAACPARAIQLGSFTDGQQRSLVHSLLQEVDIAEAEMVGGHVH
jgi:heterodisulfide reductase subunit A-like polyferredoxin